MRSFYIILIQRKEYNTENFYTEIFYVNQIKTVTLKSCILQQINSLKSLSQLILYVTHLIIIVQRKDIFFGSTLVLSGEEKILNKLNMKHKNDFLHFLKKNNIFEAYVFNFNNDEKYRMLFNHRLVNSTANCFFKTISFENYVCSSFEWYKTPEGEFFWNEINQKWINDIYG